MNNVSLIGRITKDIELRYTPSGKAVTKFTIAVKRKYSKDESDFITIQAWDKTAELVGNYLGKGSLVGIDGRIQTGSYEKDGVKVYTTDVVAENIHFLESKKDNYKANDNNDSEYDKFANKKPMEVNEDDMPF